MKEKLVKRDEKCYTVFVMLARAKTKVGAKINLTLDILGAENGFHTLDSFVVSVDLFDEIVAKKRKDDQIKITFFGEKSEELSLKETNAEKAAKTLIQTFGLTGADIKIYRNIPVGAGLGSSSADTAGVLNALKKLYRIDDEEKVKAVADRFGSDTGYMLYGFPARITGRGDKIFPVKDSPFKKLYFLLLCPDTPVSTKDCFTLYDQAKTNYSLKTEECIKAYEQGDEAFFESFSNHLYPSAVKLNKDVETAIKELQAFCPTAVNMTGSGSAVYAVFKDKELRDYVKSRYRGKFKTVSAETYEEKKGVKNPFVLGEK